jgi:hypothetical protein
MNKIIIIFSLIMTGCAINRVSEPILIGKDMYMVGASMSGPDRNWIETKSLASKKAELFCNSKSMDYEVIGFETHGDILLSAAEAEVNFRCVKK